MELKDLQSGMIVEVRNGNKYIVILNYLDKYSHNPTRSLA